MRTVCGLARRFQRVARSSTSTLRPVARLCSRDAGRALLSGEIGEQRRAGWRLDQVDSTTCGSAVLVALAAWAGSAELDRLEVREISGGHVLGFGARYDARQREVHRQTNRFWPRALGTTPWAMVAWLRRHVPSAGVYRVQLVDDVSAADVMQVMAAVDAALAVGRPVPLLVGSFVPRHYVLVLAPHGSGADGSWRVYEPTSGSVRAVDPALVAARRLGAVLGWDRLHAALLPD